MSMPGTWEWIIILAIVLVFFGGRKLPQLGGAIGESIRNFKKGISSGSSDEKSPQDVAKAKGSTKEAAGGNESEKENV